MNRAGVVAAQARERELLTELAHAIERGAPHTLDPLLRPSWEAAGTDAARRRVVVDQVASLTDTSAIACITVSARPARLSLRPMRVPGSS